MELLRRDLRPSQDPHPQSDRKRDCLGGRHRRLDQRGAALLAIAREAGVELTIDDFDRISERTPLIADLKPGGRFVANDLYRAGGIPLVAKRLIDGGLIHGDTMTVTGKTSPRRRR